MSYKYTYYTLEHVIGCSVLFCAYNNIIIIIVSDIYKSTCCMYVIPYEYLLCLLFTSQSGLKA